MKYLYNENDFAIIKKKKNKIYLFFVLDFCLEVGIILICFLLSTYHTKLLFSIIGSIFSILVAFFLVYLIDRLLKLNHLIREYDALLHAKDSVIKGEIVDISSSPITLPDGTKAFQVMIKQKDSNRILLLSDLFDANVLELKSYKFLIYYDYIRGFEDEI